MEKVTVANVRGERNMGDVQFSTLHPDGTVTNVRTIKQSDIAKCPHFIMVPEHYREDGTCKCNDPVEQARMIKDWGYSKRDFLPKKEKYNAWEELLKQKR